MHYRDVSLAVDRRRDRRTILLNLLPEWEGFSQLVGLARERHWRLLDLRYRNGDLPGGIVPDGALLQVGSGTDPGPPWRDSPGLVMQTLLLIAVNLK